MSIGSHEVDAGVVDVNEDARHDRAELVVRSGKNGLGDGIEERGRRNRELSRRVLNHGELRVFRTVDTAKVVVSGGSGDAHLEVLVVHLDVQRLVSKFAKGVGETLGVDGNGDLTFGGIEREGGDDGGLEVGSGEGELLILDSEEDVGHDFERIFGGDDAADGLHAVEEVGTGDVEFHDGILFLLLFNAYNRIKVW